jgi:hypothetical protein
VLATRLSLLKATVQILARSYALVSTLHIARVFNNNIISHHDIRLAVGIVRVFVVVVVIVIAY